MKRILVGMALTLFALAPTVSLADCDYHKASMASSPVTTDELAQAPAASKLPAPVAAKTSVAKQAKHVDGKAMSSPSKTEGSTVVAKTN
jgi:hypothetical protein